MLHMSLYKPIFDTTQKVEQLAKFLEHFCAVGEKQKNKEGVQYIVTNFCLSITLLLKCKTNLLNM